MNIKFVFALCFKFYFVSITVVPWKSLRLSAGNCTPSHYENGHLTRVIQY